MTAARAQWNYQLCPGWVDNRLHLSPDAAPLPAGTRWHMNLTLILAPAMTVLEEADALGRQALDAGEIDFLRGPDASATQLGFVGRASPTPAATAFCPPGCTAPNLSSRSFST